jgi:hypothetical protein
MICYRFEMRTAYESGATRHPQIEIRKVAPDARNFTPQSMFDCWTFHASEITNPPDYIRTCEGCCDP